MNTCPFSSNENETVFYESPSHRDAMTAMRSVLHHPPGIAMLIGESGSGKSACLQRLVAQADRECEISRLSVANKDGEKLFVAPFDQAHGEATATFEEWRSRTSTNERSYALIVDDADAMTSAGWREIESLVSNSNFVRSRIALIVAGTPALRHILLTTLAERIRTRIDRIVTLESFTHAQTTAYFIKRMQAAGSRQAIFSEDALLALHLAARGVPGAINRLAQQSLQIVAEGQRNQVLPADIIAARTRLRSLIEPTNAIVMKSSTTEAHDDAAADSPVNTECTRTCEDEVRPDETINGEDVDEFFAGSDCAEDTNLTDESSAASSAAATIAQPVRFIDDPVTSMFPLPPSKSAPQVAVPSRTVAKQVDGELEKLTRLENQLIAALSKVHSAKSALIEKQKKGHGHLVDAAGPEHFTSPIPDATLIISART